MAVEAVDHPAHYGGADNPYEVIKVLEAWLTKDEMIGFLKGNVIKYQARALRKAGAEDYAKAAWYGNYLAEMYRRRPPTNPNDLHADTSALQEKVKVARELLEAQLPNIRARVIEGGSTVDDVRAIKGALDALT